MELSDPDLLRELVTLLRTAARVLARTPAVIDAAARELVEAPLFEAWLEERAQAAHVEWFWGNADDSAFADADD